MTLDSGTVLQTLQQIQVAQCEKAILSPDLGNDTVDSGKILQTPQQIQVAQC